MNQFEASDSRVHSTEETISLGGVKVRFLLTGDNSSGSVAAFEMIVAGGQKIPAPTHSHEHFEETIYGVSGVLTWTVDGKVLTVGPGQLICIPRGVAHRFDNNTSEEVKTLCVITPAAIGPQYFREMAALLEAAVGGPPDRAKAVEIMLRHGFKPAMPPA